tara:strand:+ start:5033 stop:5311 length:279 start_codon:yes stop_codon:yes gene_type:complete
MINDSAKEEKVPREDTDWLLDMKKSRDITREILRFGVSQTQIVNIIKLLALELENHEMMRAIGKATEMNEEEDDFYISSSSKIIQPGGEENE